MWWLFATICILAMCACIDDHASAGYTRRMVHRTTIELDTELLDEARRILGTSGIRDTVETALRELARADRRRRLAERITTGEGFDRGSAMLAETRPTP